MSQKKKRVQPVFDPGWYPAQFNGVVKTQSGMFRLKFIVYNDKLQKYESFATNRCFSEPRLTLGGPPEQILKKGYKVQLGITDWNQNTITAFRPDASFVVPEWARKTLGEWQAKDGKEAYIQKRMQTDPRFKRIHELREIQYKALKGELPVEHTKNILGTTYQEARKHVEAQFRKGMTWQNRGSKWELDHIKSLTRFDVFKLEEMKQALHYTNLQVLTPKENQEKFNREDWNSEPKSLLEYFFGEDQEKEAVETK